MTKPMQHSYLLRLWRDRVGVPMRATLIAVVGGLVGASLAIALDGVGLDADESRPQTILSGDRNITNGLPRSSGILSLEPDRPAGWTAEIHIEQGNIGLADGSVQQVTESQLSGLRWDP